MLVGVSLLVFFITKAVYEPDANTEQVKADVLLERIRPVLKLTTVEGDIVELFTHKDDADWGFSIPYVTEKRAILRKIKDRVLQKFNCAIAEVGDQDVWQSAQVGFAVVSNERGFTQSMVQKILAFIDDMAVAKLTDDEQDYIDYGDGAVEGGSSADYPHWEPEEPSPPKPQPPKPQPAPQQQSEPRTLGRGRRGRSQRQRGAALAPVGDEGPGAGAARPGLAASRSARICSIFPTSPVRSSPESR